MSFQAFFWIFGPLATVAVVVLDRRRLRLGFSDLLFLIALVLLAVMFIGLAVTPEIRDS
jgi:hypothetical protein